MVRKPGPPTEFRRPHGGRDGNHRDFIVGKIRQLDLIRRGKARFIIVNTPALGQERGQPLSRIVAAAAPDAHQGFGLGRFHRLQRLRQHGHRRMRQHPGVQSGTTLTQRLLHPLHHIGMLQNRRAANNHGRVGHQLVERVAQAADRIRSANHVARHGTVVIRQSIWQILWQVHR